MKTRGNQLVIQILLIIVITAIVAYTCVSLAELVDRFCDAAGEILYQFNFGF